MQIIAPEANPSAGQAAEVPVHVSATSQSPAEARHKVPAGVDACVQARACSLHPSVVHACVSLQSRGVPAHAPAKQVAPIVQYRLAQTASAGAPSITPSQSSSMPLHTSGGLYTHG